MLAFLQQMSRLRVAIVLVAVLVLAVAAVLAVSMWPQPDSGAYRVGYGYKAPSQPVLDYIQRQGIVLVSVDLPGDRAAIPSGRVDAEVTGEPGLGSDGHPVEWVDVSYDPQLARSVYAAHRLQDMIDGYKGSTAAHALLSPIADEPASFHLFFAVLLPFLIVLAATAGAIAGAPGRPFRYALLTVVALQLLLFFVLPGTDFQGPENTSSRIGWLSPFGIGAEMLVSAILVTALMPSLRGTPRWWPATGVAVAAVVLAFLFSASLWDSTPSAWAVSNAPQLVTGGGLLACAVAATVLARTQRRLSSMA